MDPETFLTTVYVCVDDFVKARSPQACHPGPRPSLSCSEVVTLAVVAQWQRFPSERTFYRYADCRLRSSFPSLPDRSQFNRLVRKHRADIIAFALHLADLLQAHTTPYQVIDGMAVKVRDHRRRGRGWLCGRANIGHSNRLGWFAGFYLLTGSTKEGVLTGFGLGPASTNDRRMAEAFFAARHQPEPGLPWVGTAAQCSYLADKGFTGREWQERWRTAYGAEALCLPQVNNPPYWPKAWRRWHAGLRQIAETVHAKLLWTFRLEHERPHSLDGLLARLGAMQALHNFCIWLNQQLGRRRLQFVDLFGW